MCWRVLGKARKQNVPVVDLLASDDSDDDDVAAMDASDDDIARKEVP